MQVLWHKLFTFLAFCDILKKAKYEIVLLSTAQADKRIMSPSAKGSTQRVYTK